MSTDSAFVDGSRLMFESYASKQYGYTLNQIKHMRLADTYTSNVLSTAWWGWKMCASHYKIKRGK